MNFECKVCLIELMPSLSVCLSLSLSLSLVCLSAISRPFFVVCLSACCHFFIPPSLSLSLPLLSSPLSFLLFFLSLSLSPLSHPHHLHPSFRLSLSSSLSPMPSLLFSPLFLLPPPPSLSPSLSPTQPSFVSKQSPRNIYTGEIFTHTNFVFTRQQAQTK